MIYEMKNLLMINPKRLCLGERNVMININKNKKRMVVSVLLILLMTLTILLVSSSNAFATDYAFSFRVPPHCGNGQEKYAERPVRRGHGVGDPARGVGRGHRARFLL